MSMNKIILFTVAVNFIAFDLFQITNADELAAEKTLELEGVWYTVAMVHPNLKNINAACDRTSVKMDNDNKFSIVDRVKLNGLWREYLGTGEIIGSEIHTKYPLLNRVEDVCSYKSYNNGEELILHDKVNKNIYVLHSRKRTASDEVKKIFESEAAAAYLTVTYIDQSNCGDN